MTCTVTLRQQDDLGEFRAVARKLLGAGIPPGEVLWTRSEDASLFPDGVPDASKALSVPRSFMDLAETVICHRDDQRWALLYQALWRIDHGEHTLMQRAADKLLHRLRGMASAVRHDQHRMTAFLRFRVVQDPDGEIYVAWYEPRHHILRRTTSFFIDRFASMRFSILTPDLTLCWDRTSAHYSAGLSKQDAPPDDAIEDWWRRYYAAIFNPARVNMKLAQRHMPKDFWHNLPEAASIADLARQAHARTDRMIRPAPSLPDPCSGQTPRTTP
jgi:uracil-DNA glycosylase